MLILHLTPRPRTLGRADRELLAFGRLRLGTLCCALVSLTGSSWLKRLHQRVTLHLRYRERLSSTCIVGSNFERRRRFHGLIFLEARIVGSRARILSFLTRSFFQGDLIDPGSIDLY